MTTRFRTAAAGLALSLLAGSGVAQEAAPAAPPAAWTLECASSNAASGPLNCQIAQRFLQQGSGAVVMVVTIERMAMDGQMTMRLLLPHGLYLPAGVSYQIDAGAQAMAPITSSSQAGALATVALSPELLAALKSGTTLTVSMETASRNALGIPVSLAGFTAAVDRLTSIN